MGVRWHLRAKMAERGMFATSDLIGPLAEHGITLSREQIYRIVTSTPQRLSLQVLDALCLILDCGVNDLIEVGVTESSGKKAAAGDSTRTAPGGRGSSRASSTASSKLSGRSGGAAPSPQRTTIRRPPSG